MGQSIQQHIVPEFLLSHFPVKGNDRLFTFDKWTEKIFATTPEKAAKEGGFYDIELDGKVTSLESPLSNLESAVAPIIDGLVGGIQINQRTKEERVTLGLFCVVQMQRDRNSRAAWIDFRDQMREHLKKLGADPAKVKGFEDPSDEEMKASSVLHIATAVKFLPYLLDKTWSLQVVPPGANLFSSDSPVTLHNERTFGFYGNIGLAVPGIEISLPISSELNLWMTCPSIRRDIRRRYLKAQFHRWILRRDIPSLPLIKNLVRSLAGKEVFRLTPANVERLNSLQVARAERFVYSRTEDFSLVRRMISDNPSFKKGRRIKLN